MRIDTNTCVQVEVECGFFTCIFIFIYIIYFSVLRNHNFSKKSNFMIWPCLSCSSTSTIQSHADVITSNIASSPTQTYTHSSHTHTQTTKENKLKIKKQGSLKFMNAGWFCGSTHSTELRKFSSISCKISLCCCPPTLSFHYSSNISIMFSIF